MKKRYLVFSLLVVSASLLSGPAAAEVYWDTDAQFDPEITSSDFKLKFQPAPEARSYTSDEIYDTGERPSVEEDEAEQPTYTPSSAPTGENVRRTPQEPSRVRSEPARPREPRNITREPRETPREPVTTSPRSRTVGPTSEPSPQRAPTAGGPTQGTEKPTGTPVPAIGDEPATAGPPAAGQIRWGAVQQGADVKPAEPKTRFHWGQQN